MTGGGDEPSLPGSPASWREFRAALKKLMARAELTAIAVERLSIEPAVRALGVETIADATVGRKIAESDKPVDARSVRTIVVTCAEAARRRGAELPDADVHRWLAARTRLAEQAVGEPLALTELALAPGGGEPVAVSRRPGWRTVTLAAVLGLVLAAAAVTVWIATRPDPPADTRAAPAVPVGTGTGDDLVSGQPPCRNPPDRATGTGLSIAEPPANTLLLGDATLARGTVSLGPGEPPPWLLLYAIGECRFYLIAPVMVDGGSWSGTLYVDPTQHGNFVAYVVMVDAAYDARLHAIAAESRSPYIVRLPAGARTVHVTVRCCA